MKKLLFISIMFLSAHAAEVPVGQSADNEEPIVAVHKEETVSTAHATMVANLLLFSLNHKACFNELAKNATETALGYSRTAIDQINGYGFFKKKGLVLTKKVQRYLKLRARLHENGFDLVVHPEDLSHDSDLIKGPSIVTKEVRAIKLDEGLLQALQLKKYQEPTGTIEKAFKGSKEEVERQNANTFIQMLKIHSIKMPDNKEKYQECMALFVKYFISYKVLEPYVIKSNANENK